MGLEVFFFFLFFFLMFRNVHFLCQYSTELSHDLVVSKSLIGRRGLEKQACLAARAWPQQTQGCMEEADRNGAVDGEG